MGNTYRAASPFAANTTMHAALVFAAVITVEDASASIVLSGAFIPI